MPSHQGSFRVGVEGDVGEEGRVEGPAPDRLHHIGVGLHRRPRRDAEVAGLGVDGPEPAVRADVEPGDVVAERPDPVAGQGRLHHGQVRLAAGAGQGGRDVGDVAAVVLDAHDDHVLGQPSLLVAEVGADAERNAFLAEQGVAAVARADAPDEPFLGEMHDVAAVGVEVADRVEALDEILAVAELLEDGRPDAGHDPHADRDVARIRDHEAGLGVGRVGVAHHVGDDVHGPAGHAAVGELGHELLGLAGSIQLLFGPEASLVGMADEGQVLGPGDVGRSGCGGGRPSARSCG